MILNPGAFAISMETELFLAIRTEYHRILVPQRPFSEILEANWRTFWRKDAKSPP